MIRCCDAGWLIKIYDDLPDDVSSDPKTLYIVLSCAILQSLRKVSPGIRYPQTKYSPSPVPLPVLKISLQSSPESKLTKLISLSFRFVAIKTKYAVDVSLPII